MDKSDEAGVINTVGGAFESMLGAVGRISSGILNFAAGSFNAATDLLLDEKTGQAAHIRELVNARQQQRISDSIDEVITTGVINRSVNDALSLNHLLYFGSKDNRVFETPDGIVGSAATIGGYLNGIQPDNTNYITNDPFRKDIIQITRGEYGTFNTAIVDAPYFGPKATEFLGSVAFPIVSTALEAATLGGSISGLNALSHGPAVLRRSVNIGRNRAVGGADGITPLDRAARLRKAGFQDHHIISDTNKLVADHKLLKITGYNLQSRQNKIWLPSDAALHPTRSIHNGRHVNIYSENLAIKMDEFMAYGQQSGWTRSQYRTALDNIVRVERQALRSGDRALNRHARVWAGQ